MRTDTASASGTKVAFMSLPRELGELAELRRTAEVNESISLWEKKRKTGRVKMKGKQQTRKHAFGSKTELGAGKDGHSGTGQFARVLWIHQ